MDHPCADSVSVVHAAILFLTSVTTLLTAWLTATKRNEQRRENDVRNGKTE